MDTAVKIWLIAGAVLLVLGLIVFALVMTLNHWDFNKLSTVKYVTNSHCVKEAFTDINIETDAASIIFIPSDADSCEVVCHEPENILHRVTVEDGCLTVRVLDQRRWYDYIGIYNGAPKITVSLPQRVYQSLTVKTDTGKTHVPGDFSFERIDITGSTGNVECFASASEGLKIQVSTGKIRLEDLSAGDVDLRVSTGGITAAKIDCAGILSLQTSTGRATLTDVSCGALTSTGSTGNMTLENVTASKDFSIVRSTGDVEFIRCDAEELSVRTDTGKVYGSLLTNKVFICQTSTGRIDVPRTATGGRCEITTSTGNIKIEIAE